MKNKQHNELALDNYIIFDGMLNTKSIERLDKYYALSITKIIVIILVTTFTCGIVLLCFDTVPNMWAFIAFCVGLILNTIIAMAAMFTPRYPSRIEIDNNNIRVEYGNGNLNFTANITSVRKVYVYADYYVIRFRYSKYRYTLCQKDLNTNNTLKDFEMLFENLLIKKQK